MRFSDMAYQRPDFDELESHFRQKIDALVNAGSANSQADIIGEINLIREDVDTAMSLARIRQTIDTRDVFYDGESSFFDENSPRYQALIDEYYKALTSSPFRQELENGLGSRLFALAEAAQKTFKPEIMEDLAEENRLCTEYMKLLASAQIDFDGRKLNLSGLGPYRESSNRETRRLASEAYFGFLSQNRQKLDSIYDSLVHVRNSMAGKLGFENFIPLAYLRMSRLDYDAPMVHNYRDSIKQTILPVANALREDQRIRLNLEHLYYYDLPFRFNTGNPKPLGSAQDIIYRGKEMYHALSEETAQFIDRMLDEGLMDLETRTGKAGGGYCSWIPRYKAPFIFSNFNGTSGDVDVLTHEAGHAFQAHMSRGFDIPEYVWPTMEAAEIHSMSMEFITWPWMEWFFGPEADKYRFMHLSDALMFIPYGALVDEFQHVVYANPGLSPKERFTVWRELEKKYLPYRDFTGNTYLEEGGFWQSQRHIYEAPFYYIDYTLAQVCAIQYWERFREDRGSAWSYYLSLCKAGGSAAFLELVRIGGLESPFEPGVLEGAVQPVREWLSRTDSSKF
ncbi:MAG TPA: M3 family oligoendopeptidase [Deltaproteobacteria bacterium]|nr:M3 family oligoendopeptidase [Deltaproteobacteria bacterium]